MELVTCLSELYSVQLYISYCTGSSVATARFDNYKMKNRIVHKCFYIYDRWLFSKCLFKAKLVNEWNEHIEQWKVRGPDLRVRGSVILLSGQCSFLTCIFRPKLVRDLYGHSGQGKSITYGCFVRLRLVSMNLPMFESVSSAISPSSVASDAQLLHSWKFN